MPGLASAMETALRSPPTAAFVLAGLALAWASPALAGPYGLSPRDPFPGGFTWPLAAGGAGAVGSGGHAAGALLTGVGFLAFGGDSDPDLFDPPIWAMAIEGTYVFDADAWGMLQWRGGAGLGPLLLGPGYGLVAGREYAAFVFGLEAGLPVRMPLGDEASFVAEPFLQGNLVTTPSVYPHHLLAGLRVRAW